MKPLYLLYLAAVVPTLALADIEPTCEELWFSRNAMLDDAGYCFSSPLGRSLFDNADCTTQAPQLSPEVAEQIARIQALELSAPYVKDGVCTVDTNQTSLTDVQYLDLRRRLKFQPSTDGGSSACVGYRGAPVNLYAAPSETAEVLGQIPLGASVSSSHLPWEDWEFTMVWRTGSDDEPIMLGWYRGYVMADAAADGTSENCDFISG